MPKTSNPLWLRTADHVAVRLRGGFTVRWVIDLHSLPKKDDSGNVAFGRYVKARPSPCWTPRWWFHTAYFPMAPQSLRLHWSDGQLRCLRCQLMAANCWLNYRVRARWCWLWHVSRFWRSSGHTARCTGRLPFRSNHERLAPESSATRAPYFHSEVPTSTAHLRQRCLRWAHESRKRVSCGTPRKHKHRMFGNPVPQSNLFAQQPRWASQTSPQQPWHARCADSHRLPLATAQATCCPRVRSSHLLPLRSLVNCTEPRRRSTPANRCGARRPSQLVKALSATTPVTSWGPIQIRPAPRSCRHSGRSLRPKACANPPEPSIFCRIAARGYRSLLQPGTKTCGTVPCARSDPAARRERASHQLLPSCGAPDCVPMKRRPPAHRAINAALFSKHSLEGKRRFSRSSHQLAKIRRGVRGDCSWLWRGGRSRTPVRQNAWSSAQL